MVYVSIFLGSIIVSLFIIVFMLITMIKQGDERYEMIVGKACRNTLFAMLGYLMVCVIERAINTFNDVEIEGINPFWQLLILTLFYLIQLFYYKKKYGD